MSDDLVFHKGSLKKNIDPVIKDPNPFKSKDGSYYATMEEVRKANDEYFQKQKKYLDDVKEEISLYKIEKDEEYLKGMKR